MKMTIKEIKDKPAFICDMDGVLYHGNKLLPGVKEFVNWLKTEDKRFLFLTNGSSRTPRELSRKLLALGVEVSPQHFYTSALATAEFLKRQKPDGSAYVIGDAGVTNALYNINYTISDTSPDYVVISETNDYTYPKMIKAVECIKRGAKLIGTNPDLTGPGENGIIPATGSLTAPIELSTGSKAYYIGKPNPLMMRHALKKLGMRREDTVIIGDRMDTDILAGIETEITTVLVLSGVTARDHLFAYAYQPDAVLNGVSDLVKKIKKSEKG